VRAYTLTFDSAQRDESVIAEEMARSIEGRVPFMEHHVAE